MPISNFKCRMFRVSLHEERGCIFHDVLHDEGGRKSWKAMLIIKFVLLWFKPCPSSRIFFGDSTTGDEDGSQGARNTF